MIYRRVRGGRGQIGTRCRFEICNSCKFGFWRGVGDHGGLGFGVNCFKSEFEGETVGRLQPGNDFVQVGDLLWIRDDLHQASQNRNPLGKSDGLRMN